MPNIRIDTGRATLAALLFAASMTATGALAQTATDSAPGKPLQLVQNIKPASKAVATKSTKTAAKAASKTKATRHRTFAQRKRAPAPAQIAQGPADARSTAPALPFAGAAAVAALSLLPAETMPSELVVGGQTVQFGSPEKLNEIDLAAKDDIASAGAANPQPGNDVAEAAAKSDLANAPPQSSTERNRQHGLASASAGRARRRGRRRLRRLASDRLGAATDVWLAEKARGNADPGTAGSAIWFCEFLQ